MYTIRVIIIVMLMLGLPGYSLESDASPKEEFDTQMRLALKADPAAQFRVAQMYEKGSGTHTDMALAYLWYRKAALQGHAGARERLAELDNAATREIDGVNERERMDAVVKALRERPGPAEPARPAAVDPPRPKAPAKPPVAAHVPPDAIERAAREKAALERAATPPATRTPASEKPAPAEIAKPQPVVTAPVETPPTQPTPAARPATAPPATAKTPAPATAEDAEFSANPCKGPSARFLSTCK